MDRAEVENLDARLLGRLDAAKAKARAAAFREAATDIGAWASQGCPGVGAQASPREVAEYVTRWLIGRSE